MILPEIQQQITKIRTLKDALNVIEQLVVMNLQLLRRIEELESENARLKKQSGKPHIPLQKQKSDYSSSQYILKDGKHAKSVKQVPIDRNEILPEIEACECGSSKFTVVRTWNKLVQGLIIKRDNVLYHGKDKRCLICGKLHRSKLPENVKGVEFSPELRSWLSIFKYDCRMSEIIVSRFLSGLGVQISTGLINKTILENSKGLGKGYTHLKIWGLKLSRYLHSDATGSVRQIMATGERLRQNLNFVGHKYLSLFKITGKYNSLSLAAKVLGKRVVNATIYISDDASPNGRRLSIRRKQLCWLHEIRHYLKLSPYVKAHKQEIDGVIDQLWRVYQSAKKYGRDPTPEGKQEVQQLFASITQKQAEYGQLAHRLDLTKRKKKRLLLFLDYPGIPIENNLAERDLRQPVIIRRLSGGTKSLEGDRSFERHLSIIQTAHKQGLNIFDTVHGLIMGTVNPFVLTGKTLPALTTS